MLLVHTFFGLCIFFIRIPALVSSSDSPVFVSLDYLPEDSTADATARLPSDSLDLDQARIQASTSATDSQQVDIALERYSNKHSGTYGATSSANATSKLATNRSSTTTTSPPQSNVNQRDSSIISDNPSGDGVVRSDNAQAQGAQTVDGPIIVSKIDYAGQPPTPTYPSGAIRARQQGKVVVRLLIGTQGEVKIANILVSSGASSLDQAAVLAAKQARFKPYTRNGLLYEAQADIPFEFVLR